MNRRSFLQNLLLGVGAAVAAPVLATPAPVPTPTPQFAVAPVSLDLGKVRSAQYDIVGEAAARAREEIMAEEDRRFLELLQSL